MSQISFASNHNYLLTTVAGEHVVVPIVDSIAKLAKVVSINEMGAFIFRAMEQGKSTAQITDEINGEYDVPADFDLAEHVAQFTSQMVARGFFTQNAIDGSAH